jgi:hypothetical protein
MSLAWLFALAQPGTTAADWTRITKVRDRRCISEDVRSDEDLGVHAEMTAVSCIEGRAT